MTKESIRKNYMEAKKKANTFFKELSRPNNVYTKPRIEFA